MGLWGKKRSDEIEAETEEEEEEEAHEVEAPKVERERPAVKRAPRPKPAPRPEPAPRPAAAAAKPVELATSPAADPYEYAESSLKSYGIEDAIQLMNALPVDENVELVMKVVKSTLESTNVHITDIIADASHKQESIRGRISGLTAEIAKLDQEIHRRRDEIVGLEADLRVTTRVKEHLEVAQGEEDLEVVDELDDSEAEEVEEDSPFGLPISGSKI